MKKTKTVSKMTYYTKSLWEVDLALKCGCKSHNWLQNRKRQKQASKGCLGDFPLVYLSRLRLLLNRVWDFYGLVPVNIVTWGPQIIPICFFFRSMMIDSVQQKADHIEDDGSACVAGKYSIIDWMNLVHISLAEWSAKWCFKFLENYWN